MNTSADQLHFPARKYGPTGSLVLNIAVRRIQVDSVTECSSVPYTYKSLALVWLITLGLLGLTASGVVAGPWLLLFVLVGLATPALLLRSQHRVGVIARSRKRRRVVSEARDQSPLDPGATDVSRWESDGGARPRSLVMTAREV
jgi:hypothetical protein